MRIEIVVGNIAAQPDAEAIINSANANLRFGSGVAGAIHTAAGQVLEEFCKPFAPLHLGKALITPAFNLPNKSIIHLRAGHYLIEEDPEKILNEALNSMLTLVKENNIKSIALPAIGTGVFKFPISIAADIIIKSLQNDSENSTLEWARICVANQNTLAIFKNTWYPDDIQYSNQKL